LALSAIATAVTMMTPSSTITELHENRFSQAYYAAYSGLQYLQYSENGVYEDKNSFIEAINADSPYTLSDGGKFLIEIATDSDAKYKVKYLIGVFSENEKKSESVLLLSDYGRTFTKKEIETPPDPSSGTNVVMYTTHGLTLNANNEIDGTIYGKTQISINGGAVVEGDAISEGLVTINNGTVRGIVCSRGNASWSNNTTVDGVVIVFGDLTMNGGVYNNNVYVTGKLTVNNHARIAGNVYANEIYINSIDLGGQAYAVTTINVGGSQYHPGYDVDFPEKCTSEVLVNPKEATFSGGADILVRGTDYVFSAEQNNNETYAAIVINSLTTENDGCRLVFDLSKGDINLLVSGNVTFNKAPEIVITEDGVNYEVFDRENISEAMKKYASRIYLESHGTISFNSGASWVGTVYTRYVNLNEKATIVGGIYTTSSDLTANSRVNMTLVESNFVKEWWK